MHDLSRDFSFGPFRLDARSGELWKAGSRLRVPDQSIQILRALLERSGELVTREELRDRLWPADTFVDFEHGLNTAVRRLRAALGDSADTPRYIETLPRRGYRFIGLLEPAGSGQAAIGLSTGSEAGEEVVAPVVIAPAEDATVPVTAAPPSSRPAESRKRRGWRIPATIAAGLVSGATLLGMSWRARTAPPDPLELPFTAMEGDELAGRFSPDGREVVFTWARDGRRADIYIKAVGSETNQPFVITDDVDEVGPVFSPDGRSIAFLRTGPDNATIIVKPRDGGPERPLTQISNPHVTFIGSPGPFLAWTPDGQGVIYSHERALHLWRLAASKSTALTEPPATAARGDVDPAISPDGRTLAFVRDWTSGASDLYQVPLNDRFEPAGPPVLLLANGYWNRSPAWHPDGRHLIFVSGFWGQQRLWFLDTRKPSAASPVPAISSDAHQPAVSPSGDLLYTRWFNRRQVWSVPLAAAGETSGDLKPLFVSTRADSTPRLSRDGSLVVWSSDRSGAHEIWTARTDGGELRKVTAFSGPPAGCPDLSPDSRQVVFDHLWQGQREIFMSDLYGAGLRRLSDHPASDVCPRWSADGHAVYFVSNRTGRNQIWKHELESGRTVQVTTDGGYIAEESPDGRTLYFTLNDTRSPPLLAMPTSGGASRVIIGGIAHRNFSVTSEGIYYLPARALSEVRFLELATGADRLVLRIPEPGAGRAGTIAADPKHRMLLVGMPGPSPGDLMLVRSPRLR